MVLIRLTKMTKNFSVLDSHQPYSYTKEEDMGEYYADITERIFKAAFLMYLLIQKQIHENQRSVIEGKLVEAVRLLKMDYSSILKFTRRK